MIAGPDGNLWFTDQGTPKAIGRITPTGAITEFGTANGLLATSHPNFIVAGPDRNVWFTDNGTAGAVGRITPAGTINELAIMNPGSAPDSIVVGPDGNLWFTESGSPKGIGRFTLPTGPINEFGIANGLNANSSPGMIVAGPDGNLWFPDQGTTPAIGRITPGGAITEFGTANGLGAGTRPNFMAAGADHNLWFTDNGATPAIGRITSAGAITEFGAANGLNSSSSPQAIGAGLDGNLWFADIGSPKAVGELALQLAPLVVTGGAIAARTSALVAGTVNPLGGAVSAITVQYGLTRAYGRSVTATPGRLAAGGTPVSVSGALAGLPVRTLIHYRMVATNGFGSASGLDRTLTTGSSACPPGQTGMQPHCLAPPKLTHVRQSHRTWREGRARKHGPPVGTSFSFTLDERATVSLSFTQRVGGRKRGRRCVAQTHRNRHGHACKLNLKRGTLSFTGHTGKNKVAFKGRLSRSKKLRPGTYTLAITATNAARARSQPQRLRFSIVK